MIPQKRNRIKEKEAIKTFENKPWQIRPYRNEDKASLLHLSASHYGDKEQGTEAYFDWLYSETPAGRPYVLVAEELATGDIIGFIWHIPLPICIGGRPDICYLGCNGLVRPDYRRQGIYNEFHDLIHQNEEDRLLIHGFPKPIATKALEKVGHKIVTRIPLLTLPLAMGRLTEMRLSNSLFRALVNLGWKMARSTLYRPVAVPADQWGLQITTEERFDERFDQFWQRIAGKHEIMVVRDRDFLTWRFRGAEFRPYTILTARDQGELVGYAVTRQATLEGIEAGLIMDLLVESGERGDRAGLALARAATDQFLAEDMMMAGALLLPHTQEYGLLRQAGYLAVPERFSPQVICLDVNAISPRTSNQYLDKAGRWFVSMANHDAV